MEDAKKRHPVLGNLDEPETPLQLGRVRIRREIGSRLYGLYHTLGQFSYPSGAAYESRAECEECGAAISIAYDEESGWYSTPSEDIEKPCQGRA